MARVPDADGYVVRWRLLVLKIRKCLCLSYSLITTLSSLCCYFVITYICYVIIFVSIRQVSNPVNNIDVLVYAVSIYCIKINKCIWVIRLKDNSQCSPNRPMLRHPHPSLSRDFYEVVASCWRPSIFRSVDAIWEVGHQFCKSALPTATWVWWFLDLSRWLELCTDVMSCVCIKITNSFSLVSWAATKTNAVLIWELARMCGIYFFGRSFDSLPKGFVYWIALRIPMFILRLL